MLDRFYRRSCGRQAGSDQIFYPEVNQEDEAQQLHHRLHKVRSENAREPREGDTAINQIHRHGAEANHARPKKTPARTFIDDCNVDRPDWNAKQEPADYASQSRGHQRVKIVHVSCSAVVAKPVAARRGETVPPLPPHRFHLRFPYASRGKFLAE